MVLPKTLQGYLAHKKPLPEPADPLERSGHCAAVEGRFCAGVGGGGWMRGSFLLSLVSALMSKAPL